MELPETIENFGTFREAGRRAKSLARILRDTTGVKRDLTGWIVVGQLGASARVSQISGEVGQDSSDDDSSGDQYEYNAPSATFGLAPYDWDTPETDSWAQRQAEAFGYWSDNYWTDWERDPAVKRK